MIIIFDIFLAHVDYNTAYDPEMLFPKTTSISYLLDIAEREEEPFRIMSINRLFWGDMATVFNLSDIQGYDSFLMKRYSDYLDLTEARSEANFRIAAFKAKTHSLLDAINVKYIYTPRYKLTEGGEWISLLRQVTQPQIDSSHAYAGQVTDATLGGWPQSAILAPTPSKIIFNGFIDKPRKLETAIGLSPDEMPNLSNPVLFEIYVQTSTQSEPKRLFSQSIAPGDDSVWLPAVADLSEFTGQQVAVSLVTSAVNDNTKSNALWADPVLSDSSRVELLHYGPNSIYLNKNYLPRIYLVHKATQTPNYEAAKVALTREDFDPAIEAVVEGTLFTPLTPATGDEIVQIETYTPSYTKLTTTVTSAGLLVFSDIYYPGWNVYVNGQLNQLYPANLIMRAVALPAGTHQVEFIYEPSSFRNGLTISITVLVLTLFFLFLTEYYLPQRPRTISYIIGDNNDNSQQRWID